MIPAHHYFTSACLFEQLCHFLLEYRVHCFYRYTSPRLWHCKYIDDSNCILVNELSQHKSHDLHRDASTCYFEIRLTMFEHFEKSEGRDVDLLGRVGLRIIWIGSSLATITTEASPSHGSEQILHIHFIKWIIIQKHRSRGISATAANEPSIISTQSKLSDVSI